MARLSDLVENVSVGLSNETKNKLKNEKNSIAKDSFCSDLTMMESFELRELNVAQLEIILEMAYRRSYGVKSRSSGRRYGAVGKRSSSRGRSSARRSAPSRGGVMKLVIEHRTVDPVARPEMFGATAPTGNGKAKL